MTRSDLLCYHSAYPELSKTILHIIIHSNAEYITMADILAFCPEAGARRVSIDLKSLQAQGIISASRKGYQLKIDRYQATRLIPFKQTITKKKVIDCILEGGYVFMNKFSRLGLGDSTQFKRATNELVADGILKSELTTDGGIKNVKRRLFSFKPEIIKHASY